MVVRFYSVPGYEGLYEITLTGIVRSLPRTVNSPICGGTRVFPGRILRTRPSNGYPSFAARKDGQNHTVFIHRCLATLFIPNPENKPHINHMDGDKTNFDLQNLEWCTHRENMRHAFDTGLTPRPTSGPGEMSPAAKLDWPTVRTIRASFAGGATRSELAEQFGVSKSNIAQIIRGITWREAA